MLFKLDENLSAKVLPLLREHGHDAMTVFEQGLTGYSDELIASVCKAEGRAIMTMDMDFADIRTFPPEDYPGIIVSRVENQGRSTFARVLQELLPKLRPEDLTGKLWIVDEVQIRIWPQG